MFYLLLTNNSYANQTIWKATGNVPREQVLTMSHKRFVLLWLVKKAKGAIPHKGHQWGAHLPFHGHRVQAIGKETTCDAWPVRSQTYGYIRSRRASPPFEQRTEAHVCEQLAQGCYLAVHGVGVEPVTSRSPVQHATVTSYTVNSAIVLITETAQLPQMGKRPFKPRPRQWAVRLEMETHL